MTVGEPTDVCLIPDTMKTMVKVPELVLVGAILSSTLSVLHLMLISFSCDWQFQTGY